MSGAALVIGGSGAIGAAVAEALESQGRSVVRTSRLGAQGTVAFDPLGEPGSAGRIAQSGPFEAVVWAQGANANDAADAFELETFREILDANVVFVAASLRTLMSAGAIADGARLVVVSSIWQDVARAGKFSYTVSKAAVGGLVRAASLDLAPRGITINAVLPSVIDTPMTRAMLSEEAVSRVAGAAGFGRLVTLREVADAAAFLCSPASGGITGQSVRVDLGFGHGRVI